MTYRRTRRPYSQKTTATQQVSVERKPIESPTPQQSAIFATAQDSENLIIEAVAGSGKTSTIVELMYYLGSNLRVLFLAFNKAIATELASRIPKNAEACTLHSLGYKALAKTVRGRLFVNKGKTYFLAADVLGVVDGRKVELTEEEAHDNRMKRVLANLVDKLIGLAKNCLIGPDQIGSQWRDLAYNFDIEIPRDIPGIERLDSVLETVYRQDLNDSSINFDDMIFRPAYNNLPVDSADVVMVDESQDLNAAQMRMLENMRVTNPRVRFIFVGDSKQAIYGFRGAGTDSMELIRQKFQCKSMPLSVSFRCSKRVIERAQVIVPNIEAASWANEGLVTNQSMEDFHKSVQRGDFVLCRKNAPLVSSCLALIARGKAATIVGREIQNQISNLVDVLAKKNGGSRLVDVLAELDAWERLEIEKAGDDERKASEVEDKANAVRVLSEGLATVDEFRNRLESIFSDTDKGNLIKLMTMHKSKGLESERVWILQTTPVRCKLDWQIKQEDNLTYVSITRAKQELLYLPVCDEKK